MLGKINKVLKSSHSLFTIKKQVIIPEGSGGIPQASRKRCPKLLDDTGGGGGAGTKKTAPLKEGLLKKDITMKTNCLTCVSAG